MKKEVFVPPKSIPEEAARPVIRPKNGHIVALLSPLLAKTCVLKM